MRIPEPDVVDQYKKLKGERDAAKTTLLDAKRNPPWRLVADYIKAEEALTKFVDSVFEADPDVDWG